MREVITLSLPANTRQRIKTNSFKRGFSSVSKYIQYLLTLEEDLISEEELLKMVATADKEYSAGKSIMAKSMRELL